MVLLPWYQNILVWCTVEYCYGKYWVYMFLWAKKLRKKEWMWEKYIAHFQSGFTCQLLPWYLFDLRKVLRLDRLFYYMVWMSWFITWASPLLRIWLYACTHPLPPPPPPPPTILKRPKSIFMKIEIFAFFESVNQNLSFHVHNVTFLSQELLKKLSETLSISDI